MTYATDSQIRKICSIDTSQCSDLTEFISTADKWVRDKITRRHLCENIEGVIDGSNKEFRVANYPIADADLDGDVDASDVLIYYATLSTVNNFRVYGSSKTVTSVVCDDGIINVTTAPTTVTASDGVYASYYSWNVYEIDYDLFKLISSYAAAGLAQRKVLGLAVNFNAIPYQIRNEIGGDCLETAKTMLQGITKLSAAFNKLF